MAINEAHEAVVPWQIEPDWGYFRLAFESPNAGECEWMRQRYLPSGAMHVGEAWD
jgi:hypothetical protein